MAKKHFVIKETHYFNLTAITRIDVQEDIEHNSADIAIYGRGLDKQGVSMQLPLLEAQAFIKAWKRAIK